MGLSALLALMPFSLERAPARASLMQVKTLVEVRGPIGRFVQDGQYIAWHSERRGDVVIRRLGRQAQSAFSAQHLKGLALGGRHVIWLQISCPGSPSPTICHYRVFSAGLGDRRRAVIEKVSIEGSGIRPETVAADGDVHLFTLMRYYCNYPDCDPPGLTLEEGSIERVSDRKHRTLLELPAARLAVDADRVAAVPAAASGCRCNSSPAWSPEGRLIAFDSLREGPDWEIETISPDGDGRRKITNNFRSEFDPAWAPDGASLAFVTNNAIRTANADGTAERTLVSCPDGGCGEPDWAPDGTKLAFERGGGLFAINRDGSGEVPLAIGTTPSFSPDGRRIAFADRTGGIYVVNLDGTNRQPLAGGAGGFQPSFSPDGRTIAFVKNLDIYVMSPDGANVRQLTNTPSHEWYPDWSPDGRRLAVVHGAGFWGGEIYVMNADGSGETRLTKTPEARVSRFPIEIRNTRDGSLVSRFMPAREALSIALTRRFAAVLVKEGRARRIEFFDPSSGARRGSVRVPRTAASLSAAGRTVIFRTGRTIRALDAVRRTQTVLTIARSKPIGLSIEGRRVAWAESSKKRSRIRALIFPRRG